MAIPESELVKIKHCLGQIIARVPVEVRGQLQLKYRLDGSAVILGEWRPRFSDQQWTECPVAKFRYIAAHQCWKLYWMRGSGKWEPYQNPKESINFQTLAHAVDRDEFGCFFG